MPSNSSISRVSYSTSYFTSLDSNRYKYGFNGKEKDNEINVDGGDYDFGARIYDGRLGRWLSLDPLQAKYPDLGPYIGQGNNPIIFIDVTGRDIIFSTNFAKSEFFKEAVTIARYSGMVNNLMNKFASANTGNIKGSSDGLLSRHTLMFNKGGAFGGGKGGQTALLVKVGDNFVNYEKGMELPEKAEFKVSITLWSYLDQSDEYKGEKAEDITHELIVHSEMIANILEEYEIALKEADGDENKIEKAQQKLGTDLDNWVFENKGNNSSDKKSTKTHEKMAKGQTKLGQAVDEIISAITNLITGETKPDKIDALNSQKKGVEDAKNYDIPPPKE